MVICCWCVFDTWGQANFRTISDHLTEARVSAPTPGNLMSASPARGFTSVSVAIGPEDSFEGALLISGSDTFQLREDIHYEGPGKASILIVFEKPVSSIDLSLPAVNSPYRLFFIYAPALAAGKRSRTWQQNQTACDEPEMISQQEWREGLPAPSYSRSFTETENLIVHHSATSNSLSDYHNVVRNIYLYHTQVNGWSDIGYNYLIAPDGTIFKGRDPGDGAQDRVLGAHFCGRNSGTMGVCVLGDYRFVEPRENSLLSLEHLLAWKAHKDSLDVLAEKNHPLNPSLPVIAGHRQGCATECPGEELFEKLGLLRQNVQAALEKCGDELVSEKVLVHPNPSMGDLRLELPEGAEIEYIDIINLSGQLQRVQVENEGQNGYRLLVSHINPGVYVVRIKLKNEAPDFRKVILL